MNNFFKTLEKITALIAVFFLPSQLALHFWPNTSFIFGLRIDYLSPALYFTDLIVLSLFILSFINERKLFLDFIKRYKNYFIFLILFIVLNITFSTVIIVSLYKWLKIMEFIFFGIYIYLRKDFIKEKLILKILLSSTVLISLIGITQFFFRQTTGLFYLLGERSFNITTPGIALVSLKGQVFLRAYSVFSHPNSLAGFIGLTFLIFLFSKSLKKKKVWYLSMLIILFCFILAFSLSAFIAFGFLILAYILIKSKVIFPRLLVGFLFLSVLASLLLPIYSESIIRKINLPQNIEQRMDLSYISGRMAGENFLIGEGLNTFIINSVRFRGVNIYLWLLQPVHNLFLLFLTETGMIGLISVVFALYKLINFSIQHKEYLIMAGCFFILFTGLSDHYWLTIQQNSLMVAFFLGFSLRLKS